MTIVITDLYPSLDVAHVLRGQGVDPTRARSGVVAVAQEVVAEAQALLAPAALYTTLPVRDFRHQRVVLEGGVVFLGSLVSRALAGATEVDIVVCTIGPALEEYVDTLIATGDVVRAMAFDGAGVAALGEVSRMVVARIRDQAPVRGLGTGMRASPGQEGWLLEQQRVLFGLLPAEEIGVRLTESCLMLPRKSVSFVIGLGPEMRPDAVTCDFCSKRDRCSWRVR
ncbi:MAG: vitamin B12 dependent-methionine synthase activation domain-containing protein [Chloroflexota bacterium]|nr:vitamin B12 dependent-methionine synthase activation domain-containing protein [Chloroflexota bacterium]